MKCFTSPADCRKPTGGTEGSQGFILLPLLLVVMVCSGVVLCYGRSVYQEMEAARDFLRKKQLETVAQSFMFTALQQEAETGIADAVYNLESLQPGKEAVQVCVAVNRETELGMRFLNVDVRDSRTNEFSLRQCRIVFPEPLLRQLAQYPCTVRGSVIQENSGKKDMATITGGSDGAYFPQFSVENIAVWASTDFPSALELQRDGLSGWIYLSKDRIALPKGLTVHGDGILAFADNASIGANTVFTGRIVILADRDLHIGDQVRLEKAVLLCRGKLTIGSDCFINGAVMAQQDAVIGERMTLTGDKEVLGPFQSIISY